MNIIISESRFKAFSSRHEYDTVTNIIPINKNSDYIPVMAIDTRTFDPKFNIIEDNSNINLAQYIMLLKSVPSVNEMKTNQFINHYIFDSIEYDTNRSDYSVLAKSKMYFELDWEYRSDGGITKPIRSKFNEQFLYYLYGTGFIASSDITGKCNTVFSCLTIHRKAIPLYLLNSRRSEDRTKIIREIDSKYLKLFYKTGLNEKNGPFPHMSSYFKKYIKKYCDENQIIMEEIPEFSKFFNKFTIPKPKSISEGKEILKNEALKRLLCQM